MAQKATNNPADENLPGAEGRSSAGSAALVAALILLNPYLQMALQELVKNKQISAKFRRQAILKLEEAKLFADAIVASKSWPEQLDDSRLAELQKQIAELPGKLFPQDEHNK